MEATTPDGNGNPGNGTGASGRNGEGKSRHSTSRGMARWNALKHGVLSETVVLPTEDRAPFQELLEHLRRDRKPKGALENLLLEKIAVSFWRLRRILIHDFGNNLGLSEKSLADARKVSVAAETLTKKLTDLRRDLVEYGLTEDLRKRLLTCLKATNGDFSTITEKALRPCLDECVLGQQGVEREAKLREEGLKLNLAVASKSVDTLLRYEAANERQLYRAIDQLERLQRQRAGDYVPPPVKLGLSADV